MLSPREAWNEFGQRRYSAMERFEWTQYPGENHGPGVEVLRTGPGTVVLELGVGKGLHVPFLLAAGSRVVGVDFSDVQLKEARASLGDTVDLHEAEVVEFLAARGEAEFDSVMSRFGPHWFVDPRVLFPEVRRVLKSGGVFAFSHREPSCGCFGAGEHNIGAGPGGANKIVRWDYPTESWEELLAEAGFVDVSVAVLPAPGDGVGTIMGRARRV